MKGAEYIRMAMSARKLSPVAGKKSGPLSPLPHTISAAGGVGQNIFQVRKNSHQAHTVMQSPSKKKATLLKTITLENVEFDARNSAY